MTKVVFFGSSKYVIPIIEVLQKNFDLAGVVTTDKLPTDPVIKYCTDHKVRYYVATDFRQNKTMNLIKTTKAELGVLAYFGRILPPSVLESFHKGIINTHPSLLPKYRGPTPVQTAILNGDKTTGVTIIRLDDQVDHGPILAQKEEPIRQNDTADSLHERLFRLGAEMLPLTIQQYNNKTIMPIGQDDSKATFTPRLTRESGYIDLSSFEIGNLKLEIARRIRAYYPWPGVWTRQIINNKSSIIKFLPEERIQVEGKKPVTYRDFLNGYPNVQKQLQDLLV